MMARPPSTSHTLSKTPKDSSDTRPYESIQLGVYQVTFGDQGGSPAVSLPIPGREQAARVKNFIAMLPYTRRFLVDIYRLGPGLLVALWLVELLQGLAPGARLYISNWLLNTIERGTVTGKIDLTAIRKALVAHVAIIALNSSLTYFKAFLEPTVESRASLHFELLSIQATLSRPLAVSDTGNNVKAPSHQMQAWRTFQDLSRFVLFFIQCIGEIVFVVQLAISSELGRTFLLLWVVRAFPILTDRGATLWTRGCIYIATNLEYLRLRALSQLALTAEYRQEVLAGNLGEWICKAYEHTREQFKNVPSGHPMVIMAQKTNPFLNAMNELAEDWSMLYYGVSALLGYTRFSFSTITSIQTASQSLRMKLFFLFGTSQGSIFSVLGSIKDLYNSFEVEPDVTANANSYPSTTSDDAGMALQLRDVTLTYPGSQSTRPAIDNISCTIKPGQLVVIVGANGSGKTSLVKLLTRLYDPSFGTITVDGHEASTYKLRDLRQSTALLSQDHSLFPLSILENIGLGDPAADFDEDRIRRAAEMGGAARFVEKLQDKYDALLEPVSTKCCLGIMPHHPLMKTYEALELSTNISGGERQRLVASRTFMRIASPDIKLVVVDEPSSAMDPAGEYELFKHLRECRAGKTMIFITHRFGHLTKHADVIMCLKDGALVEQGTHNDLLALDGEYSTLYNVQAQAFAPANL